MESHLNIETPVTEQSNPVSRDIDIASPQEIVSILHRCDCEIFDGWTDSGGLNADDILRTILFVASKVSEILKNPSESLVCISGCGTSGRLAYIACHTFNKHLKSLGKEPCFRYIIAGDDKALFTSQELAEDDPHTGAQVLQQVTAGRSKVVYIGISCGMSASFVAGQLDHCLSNLDKYTPVLIGFNPSHLARELPIPKWSKTFLSVVKELEEAEKADKGVVLNPIIGPDPITGSSRMKSGSATRILLEIVGMTANYGYNAQDIKNLMQCYSQTCDNVYRHEEQLGQLIKMAGESLKSNGHIYYLGCGGGASMAMVDASECPPTYGAALDDVRGFIHGGYKTLQNNDGDLSAHGKEYRISLQDFEADVIPFVQSNDLMVFIGQETCQIVGDDVMKANCKKVLLQFTDQKMANLCKDVHLILTIPLYVPALQSVTPGSANVTMQSLLEHIALKWVVNALSTGAHILKGKVCGNWMVDVRTSNTKLYLRAIGIIQQFSRRNRKEAEECLLKSIYDQEEINEETLSLPIMAHIKKTEKKDMIVPVAILLACQTCSLKMAKQQIEEEPVIRKLLTNIS